MGLLSLPLPFDHVPLQGFAAGVLVLCILALLFRRVVSPWKNGKRSHPLPDSPPGALPYLGHLFYVAKPSLMRSNFEKWGPNFGDIFTYTIGPHRFLILNSTHAIEELLGRRGAIYSSRPMDAIARAFFTQKATSFTPYGPVWRHARTLISKSYGPAHAVSDFTRRLLETEAGALVQRLAREVPSTEKFDLNVGYYALAVSWRTIFMAEEVDPAIIEPATTAVRGVTKAEGFGSKMVNLFPFLEKVPGFLHRDVSAAIEARRDLSAIFAPRYYEALAKVKAERDGRPLPSGLEPDCHARFVAESQLDGEIDEERAVFLIVGLLSATSDTTSGSVSWMVKYLAEYPEVQAKAHAVLDEVVGRDLLSPPTLAHDAREPDGHSALEYIRAIVKETNRLNPASPTGGPRVVEQDDAYKGRFIPRGSIVLLNLGHVQRDPAVYEDPLRFDPERWLRADKTGKRPGLDLAHDVWPFGAGRRICPGIYLATESLFMAITYILWAFEIRPRHPSDTLDTAKDPGVGKIVVAPTSLDVVLVPRL